MAYHEIIIISMGFILAINIVRMKANSGVRQLTENLPEIVVAIYLIFEGMLLALNNWTDLAVSSEFCILMLLFLPAAVSAEMAKQEGKNRGTLNWLMAGTGITLYSLILNSIWNMAPNYYFSAPAIAILLLLTSIFLFKGLNRIILGFALIIWALKLSALPQSVALGMSILLGGTALFKSFLRSKTSSDQGFAFNLKEFVDSIAEAFIIIDPSGKIVYSNREFSKLSGHDNEKILQSEAIELFDIPSDWRFKANSSDGQMKIRCRLICNSDKRTPVMLRLNEIHSTKGKLCNLLCIVHDEQERESLEIRLKNESTKFKGFYETSAALSSSLEMKDVLNAISAAAQNLTKADSCVIFSLDHSRQIVKTIFSSEEAFEAEVMNFELPIGQGLTGAVVADGKPRIQNYNEESKISVLIPGTKDEEESLLSVPLMAKDLVIGALTLYKMGRRCFEEDDIKVLTVFASQASAVIENSRLYMKLKASEKLYKFSVDLAGDAIFFVDPETGKIKDSNETAQRLFKYTKSEYTAFHIWELQPEPQMYIAKRLWQEVNKIGWGRLGEIEYMAHDGQKIPALVTVSIIYTGENTLVQWNVRDISEHKRALEKAGFIQQIFEHLEEPILITDFRGRSLYANNAFCAAFNITKEQSIKEDILSLSIQNPQFEILKTYWRKLNNAGSLVDKIVLDPLNEMESTKTISIVPFST